jgi:hypothetical protein
MDRRSGTTQISGKKVLTGRIDSDKMYIVPRAIYICSAIILKIQWLFSQN